MVCEQNLRVKHLRHFSDALSGEYARVLQRSRGKKAVMENPKAGWTAALSCKSDFFQNAVSPGCSLRLVARQAWLERLAAELAGGP